MRAKHLSDVISKTVDMRIFAASSKLANLY